jgi:hypothetical protein
MYLLNRRDPPLIQLMLHKVFQEILPGITAEKVSKNIYYICISPQGRAENFIHVLTVFLKANQISEEDFNALDQLHYKTENELIQLVKSLQRKLNDKTRNDSFLIF